jgi:hypothetical protein
MSNHPTSPVKMLRTLSLTRVAGRSQAVAWRACRAAPATVSQTRGLAEKSGEAVSLAKIQEDLYGKVAKTVADKPWGALSPAQKGTFRFTSLPISPISAPSDSMLVFALRSVHDPLYSGLIVCAN